MQLLVLCVALSALGSAQVAKSGAGFLFRAKYTKGQKLNFALNVSSSGFGQGMKLSSPLAITVKSVNKGIATLDVKTGPAMMNGSPQGKVETQTVMLNDRNQPVSGTSSFEGMASFTYPAKPVTIGSSWDGVTKMKTPMGEVDLKARYTFIGLKQVGANQVAQVKTTFSGTLMGKITGQTTTLVMVKDGSLFSSDGNMTIELQMGKDAAPTKIPTKMSIVRK